MKHTRTILTAITLIACTPSFVRSQSTEISKQATEDLYQELIATRWIESFSQLDVRNNITMVLVGYDKLYELSGVTGLSQNKRLLVVKHRGAGGKEYKAFVYPSSILIIKEGAPESK